METTVHVIKPLYNHIKQIGFMKIQYDKYDDLIFNMLINIQTDLQVMRNFVLNDHVERTGKSIDIVSKEYEDMYESIQVTILSQIKSRFVDGFNPDDLLAQIKV
jgi:hypothetical protein